MPTTHLITPVGKNAKQCEVCHKKHHLLEKKAKIMDSPRATIRHKTPKRQNDAQWRCPLKSGVQTSDRDTPYHWKETEQSQERVKSPTVSSARAKRRETEVMKLLQPWQNMCDACNSSAGWKISFYRAQPQETLGTPHRQSCTEKGRGKWKQRSKTSCEVNVGRLTEHVDARPALGPP